MTKNKKKIPSDIGTPVFIVGGVLLVALVWLSFMLTVFIPNSPNNWQSLEKAVATLADGPAITYGDPLIQDTRLNNLKVLSDDPRLGSESAKTTVFIFSDFSCPGCRLQYQILKSWWEDNTGDNVRVIWKGVATGPEDILSQQAAYCAAEQNKFWDFADDLISADSLSRQMYSVLADNLGLDKEKFDSCLDGAVKEDKVYDNNIDAQELGIKALPYFYIDNTPYSGVLTKIQLQAIVGLVSHK